MKLEDGSFIVKIRKGGRDNKNFAMYIPSDICYRNQIMEGSNIRIIENPATGKIEITPYIPTVPLEIAE